MKKVNRDDLLNGWLKYHNTTVKEVVEKLPKETLESTKWFDLYPVTQEQHDEWSKWAKNHIKKITNLSKKYIDHIWWSVYLDCAPKIKENDNTNK